MFAANEKPFSVWLREISFCYYFAVLFLMSDNYYKYAPMVCMRAIKKAGIHAGLRIGFLPHPPLFSGRLLLKLTFRPPHRSRQ